MASEKGLSALGTVVSGFLLRLFTVHSLRAASVMTVTGGAIGYQSDIIDLSLPAKEVIATPAEAAILDLRGKLPAHGAKEYPIRDTRVITTLFWHHTATPSTATWDAIARGHVKERNWAGIGYHVGVDRDGRIAILNPLERLTNHTSGNNTRGVGVVLLGNYEKDALTPAMEASIERVRKWMKGKGIMEEKLHRDVKATACPGKNAVAYLRAQ